MSFVGGLKISPLSMVTFSKKSLGSVIYLDASLHGWCLTSEGVCSRGPWTGPDRLCHINELELLAAFYALKSLTAQSANL